MRHIANKLTLLRIILIPVFILVLVYQQNKFISAGLFLLLVVTDILDGWIARRRKEITTFGKFMDPLTDKLLVSAALIFLIGTVIQPWMVFVIIAREFMVTGIRLVAMSKDIVIAASSFGKLKTVLQAIAIVFVILNWPYAWHLMILMVVFTVASGLMYLWEQRDILTDF